MGDSSIPVARIALLCSRLGNLWSEIEATELEGTISREKLNEGSITAFGKLFLNPSINV